MNDMAAPAGHAEAAVRVDLGDRGYDIITGPGLLGSAGARVAAQFPGARVAIVTDENVAGFHLPTLKSSLEEAGIRHGEIVLPAGEATKSFAQLAPLCGRLLEQGIERGDLVLAFGGGVIGDLAGFAASILRRGVRFVQIPTSLLAQVDSSVGGKTGINTPQGKNLIGTFHQPSLVLADTDVLDTLPPRQLRAGYAEIAKYGLLGDADLFAWLEQNLGAVLSGASPARARAIEVSCNAKARIVEADEREGGVRALLNLGHTFGHALEGYADFSDRLLHGEAIAIGMVMAFDYSAAAGLCAPEDAARVRHHFEAVGLPVFAGAIPGGPPDVGTMLSLMRQDKKVRQGRLTLILARGIGDAFVACDIEMDALRAFLQRALQAG